MTQPEYFETVKKLAEGLGIKNFGNARDKRVVADCWKFNVTPESCASTLRPVIHEKQGQDRTP